MKNPQPFVDEATITAVSGAGGNGSVGFRREKFVSLGGPNGGDGGRGGDVVLVADRNLNTLTDLKRRVEICAQKGANGGTSRKTGAGGATAEIRLPVGTLVYARDPEAEVIGEDDDLPVVDLTEDGQRFLIARGGNGGFGNARFKNPTRQTPDFALAGRPGEIRELRLSLKLLADVGLVGFPNAGKSTLLRRISAARPKVASYPFTTLTPSLGVVEIDDARIVVADIPGLIEGASDGAGLGHQFLRHVERTRVLVHLLDVGAWLHEGRDLPADYRAIRRELLRYRGELAERREIVVLNKVDLVEDISTLADLEAELAENGIETLGISGATGKGTEQLLRTMLGAVTQVIAEEKAGETEPPPSDSERQQA
ncbi:MAG: GTPase ObgE [Myxococcota bacterium]|nr:GTPase ObgE [Myxococcota bacterium]